MIAKTLPTIDQMLGAISSTAPAVGDVTSAGAGTTPFDQLMASLTLPSAAQPATLQPGKIAPVSFQPAAPVSAEAVAPPTAPQPAAPVSFQPAIVGALPPAATVGVQTIKPVQTVAPGTDQPAAAMSFQPASAPVLAPALMPVETPVAASPIAPSPATSSPVAALAEVTALLDGGKALETAEATITPETMPAEAAAAIATPIVAQPAPDAAAILTAAGVQMPVQTVATPVAAPAKAEAATAAVSPAILQTVATPPVLTRPTKAAKSEAFTPGIVTADASVAPPFVLDTKIDAPAALEQPVPVEAVFTKAEAAPVILLHKQTPDAITLAPPTPANDVAAATQTELASHSLETRLDVAQEAQWIDRAAKDIALLANGEGRLRFRLDPDHLGSLQIDMANGSDGLSMRMTAETEAARVILAEAQPRLIAEARAQGVRIAEAHIDMGQQSSGGGRQASSQDQQPVNTHHQTFEGETADSSATPASNERFA